MTKKYDIITIGGATEDVTMHTEEGVLIDNKKDVLRQKLLAFEYGTKIKITHSSSTFGGGAANVAVAASSLGLKAAAIIAVGDDNRGRDIIVNLKKKKVDTKYVQKISGCESGLSFLLMGQENEHIVFSARGANSKLVITKQHLNILKNTEWIYLTSLSGKWEDILKNIFKLSKVKIAWNPGHIQLKAGIKVIGKYLIKTSVLIINKDEAIELVHSDIQHTNKGAEFFNDIESLLRVVKNYGPEIVVITNGEYGSYAFDGKNDYYQPIIQGHRRVDTTGVGDAFGASFVSGLVIYKGNIAKSLFLGARNTSRVVSKPGAQNGLLKKEEI